MGADLVDEKVVFDYADNHSAWMVEAILERKLIEEISGIDGEIISYSVMINKFDCKESRNWKNNFLSCSGRFEATGKMNLK